MPTSFAFVSWFVFWCFLLFVASALVLHSLGSNVREALLATYVFLGVRTRDIVNVLLLIPAFQRLDDLSPNSGLWWYFFAEIFDQFRPFYLLVFNSQVPMLMIPLTIHFRRKPYVLATFACVLMALFKVRCP